MNENETRATEEAKDRSAQEVAGESVVPSSVESGVEAPANSAMNHAKPSEERAKSRKGPIVALVALVVVIAIGFFAYDALTSARSASHQSAASSSTPEPIGNAADNPAYQLDAPQLADYDVAVYTDTGEPRQLTEIADGKPLVINFWATWCPYCIQEMPDYQELYKEYGDRVSFAFVDCADGTRETVEVASAWLADNGFEDLPAFYDRRTQAQYTFGVASLPTTVVVSASGEILTISPGRIDPALMREALDSVLA